MLRPDPRPGCAVERHQHERPVVALGQARGDDPDHPGMPVLAGEHIRSALAQRRHLTLGVEQDARLGVLALVVGAVELGRDLLRADWVLGEHQLETGVGAVHPPHRVQPRRQRERHRALVQLTATRARHGEQRTQARLRRRRQRPQAAAHQRAVLALQRDHVGDRCERHEVEVFVGAIEIPAAWQHGAPSGLPQAERQLVRNGGRAQVGTGVAAHRRMHDRRPRQRTVGARGVVIADHHLDPQRPREIHLLHRRDATVRGNQQARAAHRQAPDRAGVQPIPVAGTVGQIPVHVGSQRAQDAHQHCGGADPVDVVVAVHRDPHPGAHLGEDRGECLVDPLECGGRMLLIGRQEGPRPLGVGQPAAHQHLRNRPANPQLPFERLHLGCGHGAISKRLLGTIAAHPTGGSGRN